MKTDNQSEKCLKRWGRQMFFIPLLQSRWLTKEVKNSLSNQVTEAEKGHRGEIFLIVENHLPIKTAYYQDCRERAIDLFSQYRVWDTEENTGVLVYVNICERNLQIIADRGINKHVTPTVWKQMCYETILGLRNGMFESSLSNLLIEIGELLRQHYYLEHDPQGNELSDTLVYLR